MKNEIINVAETMKNMRNGKPFIMNRLKIEICDKVKDTFIITTSDIGNEGVDIISAKHVRWLLRVI